eukprot:8267244-Alexandrium_andersonii.AAC.1
MRAARGVRRARERGARFLAGRKPAAEWRGAGLPLPGERHDALRNPGRGKPLRHEDAGPGKARAP